MTDPDSDPADASRARTFWIAAGALAAAACVLIVVLLVTPHRGHPANSTQSATGPQRHPTPVPAPSSAPAAAELTVHSHDKLANLPRSFLGLSTEYWTLPVDELHIALYERVLSLIHVPGDGPIVLRIGGDSSDHTFYDPTILHLPRWTFDLTPQFVARTATIVRQMRLRVILDLNLITGTPPLAAAWAQEAERAMPRGSIIGYEIGNEPDLYSRAFWLLATEADRFGAHTLPNDITPRGYVRDFGRYARALSRVAPHAALFGPALANPGADRRWISTLLAGPHPGLRVVSGHRYPYSACAFPGSRVYPTIDRLLSENATARMAQTVKPAVRLADQAGLRFRLTELNSITCGGLPGVSDTFATALWAPDAVFELARTGAVGINLHAREHAINDPFTFDARGLLTRPLLYGLILFARTLGPDARLMPTRLHVQGSLHLKAWVVRAGKDMLRVLLIDKGPRSVRVGLALPATAAATLERLLAPSPGSRSGVTLEGQSLDHEGNWVGRPVKEAVVPRAHRYLVTLPRYSAALLNVRMTPGKH